jgi:hypothetical protein
MPRASAIFLRTPNHLINAQDERAYLDSVNFPFIYQNYNGVSITIENEEDYRTN